MMLVYGIHAQHIINPPKVKYPVFFDESIELRNMDEAEAKQAKPGVRTNFIEFSPGTKLPNQFSIDIDPVVQESMGNYLIDTVLASFDGVSRRNGATPPDTQGDVGPYHYFQVVNRSFGIWDKQGNILYGPVNNWTLFDGIGLDVNAESDPIVVYDHMADRWFFGEMAYHYPGGPYYMVIAVSTTGDPLGSYYRYAYYFENICDYPKFGVWPDGYYMTINQFKLPSYNWAGAAVAVYERDSMLIGVPDVRMIFMELEPQGGMMVDPFSFLPADLDGELPPQGTPNYLAYFKDDSWGFNFDFLSIWECHVDWSEPDASSLEEVKIIRTAPFDANVTNFTYITQPDISIKLQSLSNRLMYSLKFRVFDDHFAMVTNHTVDVEDRDHAGVRWYEMRMDQEGWDIYQQGTYAPDDDHRWMGSVAMDKYGNIALGYSVSSEYTYPSVRLTGRRSTDPLGIMTLNEREIATGGNSQIFGSSRWGDYSMMTIDPVDDLTFWYTQEYMQAASMVDWYTRIASFQIDQDTITSISDNEKHIKKPFDVFPNPTAGGINIKYDLNNDQFVDINIYDINGRQVMNIVHETQNKGPIFLYKDLGKSLDQGVYFCRIISNELQTTEKILLLGE